MSISQKFLKIFSANDNFNGGTAMARKLGADELAIILSQEIENKLAEKLGKVSNPVLKSAIEEALRDAVYAKLQKGLSAQLTNIVDESLQEITNLFSPKTTATTRKPSLRESFANDDSGSKDSGSKVTPTPIRRSIASGGKSSGFGGK
jgi:hypothetical protein